jgi:hypothetical protein
MGGASTRVAPPLLAAALVVAVATARNRDCVADL